MLKIINERGTVAKFATLGVGDIFLDAYDGCALIVIPESFQACEIKEQANYVGIDSASDIDALEYNALDLATKTLRYLEPDDKVIIPIETILTVK
jgi:hypothetical protein